MFLFNCDFYSLFVELFLHSFLKLYSSIFSHSYTVFLPLSSILSILGLMCLYFFTYFFDVVFVRSTLLLNLLKRFISYLEICRCFLQYSSPSFVFGVFIFQYYWMVASVRYILVLWFIYNACLSFVQLCTIMYAFVKHFLSFLVPLCPSFQY